MAIVSLRLWWVVAVLLVWSPQAQCRNVTHEDIRDAMMSLIHMFRNSEDKLERHELREKALGDQLRKMIIGIDKRQRTLEPIKGVISRLDERLSNVETIILQKEEREKATQKKTHEALEEIQKSLQALTNTVNKNLKPSTEPIENNLTTNDDEIGTRLSITDSKIDAVKSEIENLKRSLTKENLQAMCLEVATDMNPFERHISEAEKLLSKYELKLNEYGNSSKVVTDFVPLSEVTLADEAWHSKMTEVMERQEKEINKIQRLLSDAESMWKGLARAVDLNVATNQTLQAFENAKNNLNETVEQLSAKLTTRLQDMTNRLATTNEDIQQSLTQGNTMSERAFGDMSRKYDLLLNDVHILTKNEKVIQDTADNVIATKKRIEYGVYQIMNEIGELIKSQSRNLNKTINERLENIETAIIVSHSDISQNLSSKLESEISQVRRQIGVMYQQMTASKLTLDKISQQTENYVNVSGTAMDDIKNKVGVISSRMFDVGDNLNYLLGKLSLVAQEFGRIKDKLSDSLDKIKEGFSSVQTKLEGPGPHPISSSEVTTK